VLQSSQAELRELGLDRSGYLSWLTLLVRCCQPDDELIPHNPVDERGECSLSEVSFTYRKETLHTVLEKCDDDSDPFRQYSNLFIGTARGDVRCCCWRYGRSNLSTQ
jgi:hypothetical protein